MATTIDELIGSLPDALRERTRIVSNGPDGGTGEFVLYWMRTAVRADENPALDVATAIANLKQLPLLVYHGLSERYPFASDRHHTFILQGARDVQLSMREAGVAYAFHLERPGQRGPHLKSLSARAGLVVTEDMPVTPLRGWTHSLCQSTATPVVTVDTACVLPMQLVGRAYDRAIAYRKATKRLYQERLEQRWKSIAAEYPAAMPPDLPFKPLDLQAADLGDLVGQCEIDHTVGPVPHTVGGSRVGNQRWMAFKETKLARYARTRNNPLSEGVSRLSAYLHYGMISPLKIAREAAEIDNDGAEKFLDELIIWRELAYAFCFYREDHDEVSTLPEWAIATLSEHETDARPAIFSWEKLARARTADVLWDAAQMSLMMHGELHNNVRMTWGKALLNWTKDAQQALATMIDLNHRYALDGRDPASYGGILWCLGQFDRPFPPARPIFGTVRDRSTAQHAERLDPNAYRQQTTRPLFRAKHSVAVLGAGMAGLMCARTLQDHGVNVTVFEKSRGPGGRMSTRRTEEDLHFDHGAQYFTARDARFQRYVDSWQHDGLVEPWEGQIVVLQDGQVREEKRGTDRYVGMPGMNAICRHLAGDLKIGYETKVAPPIAVDGMWHLTDDRDEHIGRFDSVIVSAPAAQSAELLAAAPTLAEQAKQVRMAGCWAVLVAVDHSLQLPFDGAFVHDSPLSWIARNSAKPSRHAAPETWVLHASPAWSEQNLERDAAEVESELMAEFWKSIGVAPSPVTYSTAHRWRFALPTEPLDVRCLFDEQMSIGACGDWCGGPRVEGAFLSGSAAAGRLLSVLAQREILDNSDVQYQPQLF